MTLSWQISIIDGLIKENPQATVGDYCALMFEISNIENQTDDMGSRKGKPSLTIEQKGRIVKMASDGVSVPMMARIMGVGMNAIYVACAKEGGIEALRDGIFTQGAQKHAV